MPVNCARSASSISSMAMATNSRLPASGWFRNACASSNPRSPQASPRIDSMSSMRRSKFCTSRLIVQALIGPGSSVIVVELVMCLTSFVCPAPVPAWGARCGTAFRVRTWPTRLLPDGPIPCREPAGKRRQHWGQKIVIVRFSEIVSARRGRCFLQLSDGACGPAIERARSARLPKQHGAVSAYAAKKKSRPAWRHRDLKHGRGQGPPNYSEVMNSDPSMPDRPVGASALRT